MKRLIVLFMFVSLSFDSAYAENSKYFVGAGALSCREYNAAETYKDSVFIWIQGYMTGMNVALKMAKVKQVDLWSMSVEEQEVFIKNYCLDNSGSFLAKAGDALFDRLIKIQQ